MGINKRLLREGDYWGLHVEHDPATGSAGKFTPNSAGWKFLIHITVSPWGAIESMARVLKDKHAEPHLLLGGRAGQSRPVLKQMLPFDVAGRSLQNDASDRRQTNRAKVIQLEICANPGRSLGFTVDTAETDEQLGEVLASSAELGTDLFALDGFYLADVARRNIVNVVHGQQDDEINLCMREDNSEAGAQLRAAFASGVASWGDDTYKALGNVFELVRHRVPIPNKLARRFTDTRRLTDKQFEEAEGALGHMHAPDNTHIDPTEDFEGSTLVRYTDSAPNKF